MVIMLTINNSNVEVDDSKFRENLRSQLRQGSACSDAWFDDEFLRQEWEAYRTAMDAPFVRSTLRWTGGVAGATMFTAGIFWFLSFLGFVLPWYAAFSVLFMIVGGALTVAALATRSKKD